MSLKIKYGVCNIYWMVISMGCWFDVVKVDFVIYVFWGRCVFI